MPTFDLQVLRVHNRGHLNNGISVLPCSNGGAIIVLNSPGNEL
ncbi:hypothetical protein [Arthrobacter methylotrophus]